jgi:phosphoribosylformylglycinamidine (FGAM) synthase-like amidotransferase family enzyme
MWGGAGAGASAGSAGGAGADGAGAGANRVAGGAAGCGEGGVGASAGAGANGADGCGAAGADADAGAAGSGLGAGAAGTCSDGLAGGAAGCGGDGVGAGAGANGAAGGGFLPDLAGYAAAYRWLHGAIADGEAISAYPVRAGGVSAAVSLMCFGNGIGFEFDAGFDRQRLFARDYGAIVLELAGGAWERMCAHEGLPGAGLIRVGRTSEAPRIVFGPHMDMPLDEAVAAWSAPLGDIFPERSRGDGGQVAPGGPDGRVAPSGSEGPSELAAPSGAGGHGAPDEANGPGRSGGQAAPGELDAPCGAGGPNGPDGQTAPNGSDGLGVQVALGELAAPSGSGESVAPGLAAMPAPLGGGASGIRAGSARDGSACDGGACGPQNGASAPEARLRPASAPARIARPKALIVTMPGNNCEYESAYAFERAGARAEIFVVRNLTSLDIASTVRELAAGIAGSNIVMLPGGFSAGDEPDGSAKFTAMFFRNERVREAVTEFLSVRDGLMLGICNGFQALVKLGLLPFGRIADPEEGSPTLAVNRIGRYVSRAVQVAVCRNASPWLSFAREGDIYTFPVAHGEGRFFADGACLERLRANGQIATLYVGPDGRPTMEEPYNPNGSAWAIEGLTSPDGRVFGKMGHIERTGRHLLKNIHGDMGFDAFRAGVRYFQD